jgi:hypothetical protein
METRQYIDAERKTRLAWATVYKATVEALAQEADLARRIETDLSESKPEYDAGIAMMVGADVVIRQAAGTMTGAIQAVQQAAKEVGFDVFPGI